MKSITVHNIDDALYLRLREVAADQNFSLGATLKVAARNYVGLAKRKRDLSWMVGVIDQKAWDDFDKINKKESEQIDEEDWK